MDDMLARVWTDFVARTTGPMWLRLVIQPLVALVFGVRAGMQNARKKRAGELPGGALSLAYRKEMFRQALRDVGKVALVGFVVDAVYQAIAIRTFYPGEALLVAFLFVALPYQIIRSVMVWVPRKD